MEIDFCCEIGGWLAVLWDEVPKSKSDDICISGAFSGPHEAVTNK